MEALLIFMAAVALCLAGMWTLGMFNPLGWRSFYPWRVPKCTCHKGQEVTFIYHERFCPFANPPLQ